jgi:transposase
MAHVADHLSVSALEQQYRSCTDVTAARHLQTIWLLAKGHAIAEVAATVSYAQRWVERLLARYNAQGPQALGDLRRRNGTSPGRDRIIVLGLDSAGWHTAPNLVVPEGLRLAYLPPYSPELQPAEHLWPILDEPLANRYFETLADLERTVADRCRVLEGDQLSLGTNFHWWPKPATPS